MKIYNKFVESKKEPLNTNDIWFDGKVFKVYKEGEWQAITLELEAADKIYEIIKDISNVYQEKLTVGDGISIKNNIISLETFYQIVDSLPKTGKTNTIYLVNSKDAELNNKLVEYIWINNTWEKLGEYKTEIKIPTPDWNDREGEPGYIENRTHYVILNECVILDAGESAEILGVKFPKYIYYKDVFYDVPLNKKPNSIFNFSELILGDDEIILSFDLNKYQDGKWYGFAKNNTSNNERIYYDFEVKHLPDIYISDSFVKRTDINNMVATNDDIDALFDINDYYNDYYTIEPTSETYRLRDKKSILYYTSDNMNTDFIVEQEYFENNKCLSHVYDESLNVGVIIFNGTIPSKEDIQKQYEIEIDYIEYE